MTYGGKDNEELEVIFKSNGAGAKEVRLLAKGRLVVILLALLGLFSITGYLWANRNSGPESIQIPEERSFVGLNYRI